MSNFLTTRQLQEILQVDRTTIYRMADSGRVPAVKVGNQWRFPRQQVESWLKTQDATSNGSGVLQPGNAGLSQAVQDLRKILPLDCVQLIQDTFADILGVMILVTDLEGEPVTRPSNPCGLFTATESSPIARKRCMQLWAGLARDPRLQPQFIQSHLGLLCARGLIRVGSELSAMLVMGGIAPQDWPPSPQQLARVAVELDLPVEVLQSHRHEVHTASPEKQRELIVHVQRIADIVSHIIQERSQFFATLHSIAELTKI